MALRLRSSKDVKKSSYYVWYLGAREAKGVDAMPGAIAYLLERERLQEPFKVTLQVSGTISEIRFRGRKYRVKESGSVALIVRIRKGIPRFFIKFNPLRSCSGPVADVTQHHVSYYNNI